MRRKKLFAKQRKIAFVLLVAVLAVFFFLGKNGSQYLPESLNNYLETAISWVDGKLGLGIKPKAAVLTSSLDDTALSVHYMDVGQGESVFIKTTDANILIDGGENYSAPKIISYLEAQGVERLDIVVATHPHSDHIGGLASIIERFPVEHLVMPDIPDELMPTSTDFTNFLEVVAAKELTIFSAENGTSYNFENSTLTIIAPEETSQDLNNLSAIVRLDIGETVFLFTGDAEKWLEDKLVENSSEISANVLSVAHHGSKTSTTDSFLSAVSPQIAVISCGLDNSYGHPHRDIIERLEAQNVTVYRTDLDGTIVVETNGKDIAVVCENRKD